MLPTSMAMPSAGSTVPSTWAAGSCTTKMSSEVSVRTLTRMLKPSPKKALVSPRVQSGIFSDPSDFAEDLKPVRFMGVFSPCDEGWRRNAARVESGELPPVPTRCRFRGIGGRSRAGSARSGGRVSGERWLRHRGQQGLRVGNPAEDAALCGHHLQSDSLELR